MSLLGLPHHDGSELYVPERAAALGDRAVVRLRVPRGTRVDAVAVRTMRDGEPHVVRATVDEDTATDTWWRATIPLANPTTRYRFLLATDGGGYSWLNGVGLVDHDTTDADDFVLGIDAGGPEWHLSSVVYEIFPDRFAASGAERVPPSWAVKRGWDDLPTGRGPRTPVEWFGGDLPGIEQRLDHVEALGANVLYLTPFFPAGSTHRYDAESFDHVDPLLGGDAALASLTAAAHARGLRVVGDLTTNHCGIGHPWFRTARDEPNSEERGFFFFDPSYVHGYEAWLGVRTLPKLDYRSAELQRRMAAVVRHWLSPPYSLDGWRIDVANMTARHLAVDGNAEVARLVRESVAEVLADGLLVAEHGHDYRADLQGGGWQGTMDYTGFVRPVWTWLRRDDLTDELRRGFMGLPVPVPKLSGQQITATMRAFRSGRPWATVLHSWNILASHDSARFLTVSGSRERTLVGLGMQMTLPGVPMLYAGDEIGLEGCWGEDARRPLPWHRPESWDTGLLGEFRRLIALRRSSDALARGGFRFAHIGADAIAWLRETRQERLLCLATRAALGTGAALELPLAALGATRLQTLYGVDARLGGGVARLPGEGPAFHIWRVE